MISVYFGIAGFAIRMHLCHIYQQIPHTFFRYRIVHTVDGTTGAMVENSTAWTGMIGMIMRGVSQYHDG